MISAREEPGKIPSRADLDRRLRIALADLGALDPKRYPPENVARQIKAAATINDNQLYGFVELYYLRGLTMYAVGKEVGLSEARISQKLPHILARLRERYFWRMGMETDNNIEVPAAGGATKRQRGVGKAGGRDAVVGCPGETAPDGHGVLLCKLLRGALEAAQAGR